MLEQITAGTRGYGFLADAVAPQRVSAVLDGAITDLEAYGWTQGRFRDSEGRICVLEALYNQLGHGFGGDEILAARMALADVLGISYIQMSAWNDDKKRTIDDVLGALKTARAVTAPVVSV